MALLRNKLKILRVFTRKSFPKIGSLNRVWKLSSPTRKHPGDRAGDEGAVGRHSGGRSKLFTTFESTFVIATFVPSYNYIRTKVLSYIRKYFRTTF